MCFSACVCVASCVALEGQSTHTDGACSGRCIQGASARAPASEPQRVRLPHRTRPARTHTKRAPVKNLAYGWAPFAVCLPSWCCRHASATRFLPCSESTALISRSTPSAANGVCVWRVPVLQMRVSVLCVCVSCVCVRVGLYVCVCVLGTWLCNEELRFRRWHASSTAEATYAPVYSPPQAQPLPPAGAHLI